MIKVSSPRGEKLKELHERIKEDYAVTLKITGGKNKMKILNELAKKYGYSSGQSVRNIINGNAKVRL